MKPILFSTEMVKAILDGRKTVTRRLVKPTPPENARLELVGDKRHAMDLSIEIPGPDDHRIYTPRYLPGDVLYVREAFACDGFDGEKDVYVYRADLDECDRIVWGDIEKNEWAPSSDYHWRPSIHMPKEAARIFLRVTDLRVEQLQEIDGKGAEAEGAIEINNPLIREDKATFDTYGRRMFAVLWECTVGENKHDLYGWAANPWVWVIEFERCEKTEMGA